MHLANTVNPQWVPPHHHPSPPRQKCFFISKSKKIPRVLWVHSAHSDSRISWSNVSDVQLHMVTRKLKLSVCWNLLLHSVTNNSALTSFSQFRVLSMSLTKLSKKFSPKKSAAKFQENDLKKSSCLLVFLLNYSPMVWWGSNLCPVPNSSNSQTHPDWL